LYQQILKWNEELPPNSAFMKQELSQSERKAMRNVLMGTAGAEHPQYIMFWTNEALLNMFAMSFFNTKNMQLAD